MEAEAFEAGEGVGGQVLREHGDAGGCRAETPAILRFMPSCGMLISQEMAILPLLLFGSDVPKQFQERFSSSLGSSTAQRPGSGCQ
jgi:hypothetical protein